MVSASKYERKNSALGIMALLYSENTSVIDSLQVTPPSISTWYTQSVQISRMRQFSSMRTVRETFSKRGNDFVPAMVRISNAIFGVEVSGFKS